MISRTLRLLVTPGVPFQPETVQRVLSELRGKLQLHVYDCQSQAEAFDSLTHFWPDCVLMLGLEDGAIRSSVESLMRRTADLGGEDQPSILVLTEAADPQPWAAQDKVHVLNRGSLGNGRLKSLLMQQAKPRRMVGRPKPTTNQELEALTYEWMGRTTLTEESAARALFAEERFRRLVDGSHDLICVVEADGFIKYASTSSLSILGREPQELAGRYVQDYLQRCKRNNIARWFARNRNRDGIAELRMPHADGSVVSLEAACVDMTADPAVRGYVINARDITARKRAEGKLNYQARLLANIREAVIGVDEDRNVIYLNPSAERLYRVKMEAISGKKWMDLYQAEWLHEGEYAHMIESLTDHGQWQGEVIQHLSSGRRIHVEVSVTRHLDVETARASFVIVVRDIKDRKVVESVLHESENRYRSLVTVTSDLVWHLDAADKLNFISPKVSHLLGYQATDLVGKGLTHYMADTPAASIERGLIEQALAQRSPFSHLQGTFRTPDGRLKYLEISGLPQLGARRIYQGYHGAIRDVTERVEAERALRQSLSEKETLIKEIHHRVKNNMQIVSSLLYLQTQFVKDPDMLARMQESQDRIRSMALVHEKLYQSSDLSRIDFKDYLETLSRHISNSYRNSSVHLLLDLPDDNVSIGIDTAIPCGLIVNELLSNAYKHGFPEGLRGCVTVRLTQAGKKAVLEINDDGIGLPDTNLQAYEQTSLGMQLVVALVHQLQGQLEIHNGKGTQFALRFKL